VHTEVVSAILGPPPLNRVRFEGLSLDVIDQIMWDVQRMSRPRSNRPSLRRAADLAASLFDTTRRGIPSRWSATFKRTATGETFGILADGDVNIREPKVWQKAQLRPQASRSADVAAVVVDFPAGGGTATINSVEVAVRFPEGARPGAQVTLQKAVQTAVRSATPPRRVFDDGLVDLYQRLRRDMTSAEIRFLARTAPLRTARRGQAESSAGAE
jgi:hypothetical protein